MTTPNLISDLKVDEGCRLQAYPDPLSGGEPWTIGYGATGPTITKTTVWSQAMADADLVRRVGIIIQQLAMELPWFSTLDPLRQDVLCNMAYNIGIHGLLGFHNTLTFIEQGAYDAAANGMLASKWARQVPNRAKRLAEQMRTGVYA
jgi:lysozyme